MATPKKKLQNDGLYAPTVIKNKDVATKGLCT